MSNKKVSTQILDSLKSRKYVSHPLLYRTDISNKKSAHILSLDSSKWKKCTSLLIDMTSPH